MCHHIWKVDTTWVYQEDGVFCESSQATRVCTQCGARQVLNEYDIWIDIN
jgi:hypothetical protein